MRITRFEGRRTRRCGAAMEAATVTSAEASITGSLRRWERMRDAIVLTMFALTTLLGLTGEPEIRGGRPWMLALSLLFLLWYVAITRPLYQRHIAGRLPRALAYFLLGVVLWLALIVLDGPYLMYLFVLLSTFFPHLPLSWAIGGSVAITVLALWRQVSLAGRLLDPLVLVILFAAASAIGLAVSINAIIRQSLERARLITELHATRAALATAERQAGMLDERQRLAREIHDTLTQDFISIVTHLEAAEAALPDNPPTHRHHLSQARSTARTSLVEARRLVQALRPAVLERAPLPDALAEVCAQWSLSVQTSARVVTTGDPCRLPDALEMTVLRVAQEALHNVEKHAAATNVVLTLSYLPDAVILDVYDNGHGFDRVGQAGRGSRQGLGGFGLQGMHERVTELGGSLSIESAPNVGTTITVALPIVGRAVGEK